jgi:hypothetical protein
MVKESITIIAIVLGALMVLGLIEGIITGNLVSEEEEKTVIYFPSVNDFPSAEQGTASFNFAFPDADFKVGNKTADFLIFIDSSTIPGLKIGYSIKEKKFYAGIPSLISEEIKILDGNLHNLVYVFSKKDKRQAIILDGKRIAEGEFNLESKSLITGYAIKQAWNYVESPIDIECTFDNQEKSSCGCGK